MWTYVRCLKPSLLIPDLEVENFLAVEQYIDFLKHKKGIRGVIHDSDNTHVEHNSTLYSPQTIRLLQVFKDNFENCTSSNNNERISRQREEITGIKAIITPFRKPLPQSFVEGMTYMRTKPHETAVIDDRLLTGIAGGNDLGLFTIKVGPVSIASEPAKYTAMRRIENFVLEFYRN